MLEPVALAIHLQDADVVGEPSSSAPVRRSEPKTSVHSSKGRLVVTMSMALRSWATGAVESCTTGYDAVFAGRKQEVGGLGGPDVRVLRGRDIWGLLGQKGMTPNLPLGLDCAQRASVIRILDPGSPTFPG